MRQMVFAYVFVQGWTVDPYVYRFLYQPHEVLILPPHSYMYEKEAIVQQLDEKLDHNIILEECNKSDSNKE